MKTNRKLREIFVENCGGNSAGPTHVKCQVHSGNFRFDPIDFETSFKVLRMRSDCATYSSPKASIWRTLIHIDRVNGILAAFIIWRVDATLSTLSVINPGFIDHETILRRRR